VRLLNGNTHKKIGVLACALASTVPVVNSSPILNNSYIDLPKGISIVGLAIAGVAALLADADCKESKIHKINPITGIAGQGIEWVRGAFNLIIKIFFTFGIAFFLFVRSSEIMKQLSTIAYLRPYTDFIIYGLIVLFILLGLANDRALKSIPIVGLIYTELSSVIYRAAVMVKRAFITLCYVGTGIFIIIYNTVHGHDMVLYLSGLVLIAVIVFPHRSFTHSILEGFPIITFVAISILDRLGYGHFSGAFFIGYASHMLLGDVFTNDGVPLFYLIPRTLEITGVDAQMSRYTWYTIIDRILKFKIRIPIMATGTKSGNLLETAYVTALLGITIVSFIKYGASIRLI
jgi:hypothetical protein